MKKLLLPVIVLFVFAGLAEAKIVPLNTPGISKDMHMPNKANVTSLGTAIDPSTGQLVEGFMITHPRKSNKKPDGVRGGPRGGTTCYGYLANDAKWRNVENWVVNTGNTSLDSNFIFTTLASGIQKWEDAASFNILGTGNITTTTLVADESSPDNVNEVYFDELDPGTIGVTIVWGIFGGKPANRKLVEWDQIYNTYYTWSESGEAGKMDFESIATHELGHSVGMGDLYDSECSLETMYGYGDFGEIYARDLHDGDIAGVSKLY